jgi:hypothetical protein
LRRGAGSKRAAIYRPASYGIFCLILFAVNMFAWGETYVEVLDNEGNSTFGTVAELDRMKIVVDVQGELQMIPRDKLVKIRNLAPNPYEGTLHAAGNQPAPAAWRGQTARSASERRLAEIGAAIQKANEQAVKKTFPGSVIALELHDGSRLTAATFTVAKSHGVCRLLDQQKELLIPLSDLSAVRFTVRSLLEVITPPADWLRLAIPNAEGDKLVVGHPGSFDVYAGILNEVSAETVSFNVDGEILPVPRRRVFGLVFHGETVPSARESPLATLTLWSGTRGIISDIQLQEGELTWQTTTGLTVTVPLDMVNEIDFGETGIAHLFDFERTRNEFSLPFAPETGLAQLQFLQMFFESRTNISREIILDGVLYDQGITLKGKTLLEYHLPKPFASLKAVIGIEDQFRPHAAANLQILADAQVLGTWELHGNTASQQIHLNLPQNCRLITIIAEPLPQSNAPTVLTIAAPKLFE